MFWESLGDCDRVLSFQQGVSEICFRGQEQLVSVSKVWVPRYTVMYFFDSSLQMHIFLEQRVVNIESIVFGFFFSRSQTTTVPKAELPRPQRSGKGEEYLLYWLEMKNKFFIPHSMI